MGISNANLVLLLSAQHALSAQMGKVVTLGKQSFWPTKYFLSHILNNISNTSSADEIMASANGDGSVFIRKYMQADSVDEIDASSYEGATIIHDMNLPLPTIHHLQYDFVYDGGSSEHIFNIKQVFDNINALVKPGGCVATSVPANNQLGHGFYQFSPELYYRYYSTANGYEKTTVLLCEHQLKVPRFWFVRDPALLGTRIEIQNSSQLYLLCMTRKKSHVISPVIPQQSDYFSAWNTESGLDEKIEIANACNSINSSWSVSKISPASMSRRLVKKCASAISSLKNFASPLVEGPSYLEAKGLEQAGVEEILLDKLLHLDIDG
jgi:SAM-dependent methyltransferase